MNNCNTMLYNAVRLNMKGGGKRGKYQGIATITKSQCLQGVHQEPYQYACSITFLILCHDHRLYLLLTSLAITEDMCRYRMSLLLSIVVQLLCAKPRVRGPTLVHPTLIWYQYCYCTACNNKNATGDPCASFFKCYPYPVMLPGCSRARGVHPHATITTCVVQALGFYLPSSITTWAINSVNWRSLEVPWFKAVLYVW